MLEIKKHGIILSPTDLEFENFAVLNPGAYQDGETVHLYYRAIDTKHQSSIGYARLKGPTEVVERWQKPIIDRQFDYEIQGVEDPRITKIGKKFYITYVAHDGKNAVTAYAVSSDLKKFMKRGVITPQLHYHDVAKILEEATPPLKDSYFFFESYYEEQAGEGVLLWDKDTLFFPRKINNSYALIHRILPDIQICYFNKFSDLASTQFWIDYLKNMPKYFVLENKHWFESRNIGGGCVPIETEAGWVVIFHAVEARNSGRVYHAAAALLDKDDPTKVLGRLHEPLFSPTLDWEISGFVPNVVFPTATSIFGDSLYIYYGAADRYIGVAEVSMSNLIAEMLNPANNHKSPKT